MPCVGKQRELYLQDLQKYDFIYLFLNVQSLFLLIQNNVEGYGASIWIYYMELYGQTACMHQTVRRTLNISIQIRFRQNI